MISHACSNRLPWRSSWSRESHASVALVVLRLSRRRFWFVRTGLLPGPAGVSGPIFPSLAASTLTVMFPFHVTIEAALICSLLLLCFGLVLWAIMIQLSWRIAIEFLWSKQEASAYAVQADVRSMASVGGLSPFGAVMTSRAIPEAWSTVSSNHGCGPRWPTPFAAPR